MAELVIGLPRVEKAADLLSRSIKRLLERYEGIALPLPRGLCLDLVVEGLGKGGEDIEAISLRYFNPSLVRVWWSIIEKIPKLALEHPDSEIICYDTNTRPEELSEAGYRLASLLIRARLKIYGKIDPGPWIELFKPRRGGSIEIPRSPVVVADGYTRFKEILGSVSWKKVEKILRLVPTPLELLEMIARGYLDEEYAEDAVRFSIRYLGEYVVESRDLTEAYEKLLRDEEYMDLLRKIDPSVL